MSLEINKIIEQDSSGNDKSLTLGAPNVDLLAHSIAYSHKIGARDLLDGLIRIAALLPVEFRNWRYYQFLADVHAERNDQVKFGQIVMEFDQRIVNDERSVAIKLSWHLSRNEYDAAVQIGRTWLNKPKSRGNSVPLRLATAALDAGDYELVLELTARALEGSAESQPSAHIGGILFYRANAFDSLFCQEAAKPQPDCERMNTLYKKARRLYESGLVLSVSHQKIPAARRLEAMRLLLAEAGCGPQDEATQLQPEEPENDDPEAINARLMAILNAGIGAFVEEDEEAQQRAVEAFRTLPPRARALGLAYLHAFVGDEDRPTRYRDAARAFMQAINNADQEE